MPKKMIERDDSFAGIDEDTDESEMTRPPRPAMPMGQASQVMTSGVKGLDQRYVSPKILLEEEKARNADLAAQLEQAKAAGQALAADGSIVVQGFQLSPTGLIAPDNITLEAWQQVGELIFKLEGSIQWLIGDWLVYGGSVGWGELPKLVEALGRDYDTLRNYANVSRSVKLWLRNHNLSYNHHRAVASIEDENQQSHALSYAFKNGLSVAALRQWIKLGMPADGLPEELSQGRKDQLPPAPLSDNGASWSSSSIEALESDPGIIRALSDIERQAAIRRLKKLLRQLEG